MTQAFSPLEQFKPPGLRSVTGGSVASYPHIRGRENTAALKIITLGEKSLVDKEKMGNFPSNLAEDMLAVGNLILKIHPVGYGDVDPKETALNDWMLVNANVSSSYSDLTVFPVHVLENTLSTLNKMDQFKTTSPFQDFLFHVLIQNKNLYMKTPSGANVAVDSPLKKLTRCVFPDSIAAFNRNDMPTVFGNNTIDTSAFTCGIVTSEMNVPIRMKKIKLFGEEKLKTNDCNLFMCVAPSPDVLDHNTSSCYRRALKKTNRRANKTSFNYRGMEDVGWKTRLLKDTMETVYDSSLAVTYWLEPVGNTMRAVEAQVMQRCRDHGPRHPDTVQYKEIATIKIARVSAVHEGLRSFMCSGVGMTEIRAYEIDMGTEWNVVTFSYPPESTAGFGAYTLGEGKLPFGTDVDDTSASGRSLKRKAVVELFATGKSLGPTKYSQPTHCTAFPTEVGGGVGASDSSVSRRFGGDSLLPSSTRLINTGEESTLYNLVDTPLPFTSRSASDLFKSSAVARSSGSFGRGSYDLSSGLSASSIRAETDVNELIGVMLLPTAPDPANNDLLVSAGDLPKNLPDESRPGNMSDINRDSVDILREVNELIADEIGQAVRHHQEEYQQLMIHTVDSLDKLIDNNMDYVVTLPIVEKDVEKVKELQIRFRKTTQNFMLELMRMSFDTMLKLRTFVTDGLKKYKLLQKELFATFARSNVQVLLKRIKNAAAAKDEVLLKKLEVEWEELDEEMDEFRKNAETTMSELLDKIHEDMRAAMQSYENQLHDQGQAHSYERESIMRHADEIHYEIVAVIRQYEREMYEKNLREEEERYRRAGSMYNGSRNPMYRPNLTVETGPSRRSPSPSSSLSPVPTTPSGELTVLSSGSTNTDPGLTLTGGLSSTVLLGGAAGNANKPAPVSIPEEAAEDDGEEEGGEAEDDTKKQDHASLKPPTDRSRTKSAEKDKHKKQRGRSASSKRNTGDGKKIDVLFSGKVGDD